MKAATIARLDRLERLILNLHSTIVLFQEIIMTTAAEMQTKMDALTAAADTDRADAAEAKADAARQTALAELTVSLLQGLTTIIADLRTQPGPITQTQLNALGAQADAALAALAQSKAGADAANTERDAADAVLAGGVVDNTPKPIPDPLPANPPV